MTKPAIYVYAYVSAPILGYPGVQDLTGLRFWAGIWVRDTL